MSVSERSYELGSVKKGTSHRVEKDCALSAPLLLALHGLVSPLGCPLWTQPFVTVDQVLKSPPFRSPMDLLSTVRHCACPKAHSSELFGFPLTFCAHRSDIFLLPRSLILPFSRVLCLSWLQIVSPAECLLPIQGECCSFQLLILYALG